MPISNFVTWLLLSFVQMYVFCYMTGSLQQPSKTYIVKTRVQVIKSRLWKGLRYKDKLEFWAHVDLISKPVLFPHSTAFEPSSPTLMGDTLLIYAF